MYPDATETVFYNSDYMTTLLFGARDYSIFWSVLYPMQDLSQLPKLI